MFKLRCISSCRAAGMVAQPTRRTAGGGRRRWLCAAADGDGGAYANRQAALGRVDDVALPLGWTDLSAEPQSLGSLPSATRRGDDAAYALSDEQVQHFHTHGFLCGVPVLDGDEVDALLEDVDSFLDGKHPARGLFYELHTNQTGDPDNALMHALGHWRISRLFHDLAFHPAIAVPTSQLFGNVGVRLWHDQLFVKPARHGGNVAWHQDYSYWTRTEPMQHMTVHIALDDQSEENGCLQFVPGSHRWHRDGKPLPITADDFADMESIHTVLTPEERAAFSPVPSNLKRGTVSFHHPLTVHGSYPNRSGRPRRAAVVNYFADGTRSATDEELLAGVRVPNGHVMDGRFFPLVYQPPLQSRSAASGAAR